jgi:hypothetical protein
MDKYKELCLFLDIPYEEAIKHGFTYADLLLMLEDESRKYKGNYWQHSC